MTEPNFQEILRAKRDYYNHTEAAIEFAAEEYYRQMLDYKKYKIRSKKGPVPEPRLIDENPLKTWVYRVGPWKRRTEPYQSTLDKWVAEAHRQANTWLFWAAIYVLITIAIGIIVLGLIGILKYESL